MSTVKSKVNRKAAACNTHSDISSFPTYLSDFSMSATWFVLRMFFRNFSTSFLTGVFGTLSKMALVISPMLLSVADAIFRVQTQDSSAHKPAEKCNLQVEINKLIPKLEWNKFNFLVISFEEILITLFIFQVWNTKCNHFRLHNPLATLQQMGHCFNSARHTRTLK